MCLISSCLLNSSYPPASVAQPAFLGAVGQGAASTGGRGGDVYHVTSLDDYKSSEVPIVGSLRHGIESAIGPRTIVFDVGGPIALKRKLNIIEEQDLTIAGQTAPGNGITLWGYPTAISESEDIVIRYLRFRVGDFHAVEVDENSEPIPGTGNGNMDLKARVADGMRVVSSNRVMIDHVSTSWSMDESLSVTGSNNVTVQKSIISESLNASFHPNGQHGFGSLIRGNLTAEERDNNENGVTFFQNLYAHNHRRNPALGGSDSLFPGEEEEDRRSLDINFVNNVIYNSGGRPSHRELRGVVRSNFVGNYTISGPDTLTDYIFRSLNSPDSTLLHQTSNFVDFDQDNTHNGTEIDTPEEELQVFDNFASPDQFRIPAPFGFDTSIAADIVSADDAYQRIVDHAGASLRRDAIDNRIIEDLQSRQGAIIDSQSEVDGLADLQSIGTFARSAGFDTDLDGMPDLFEDAVGLDRTDPADRNGVGLGSIGLTNLEFYLQTLLLPPDYNFNEVVDAADYNVFRDTFAAEGEGLPSDGNRDGIISAADYNVWRDNFGKTFGEAVPEPSAVAVLLAAMLCAVTRRRIGCR